MPVYRGMGLSPAVADVAVEVPAGVDAAVDRGGKQAGVGLARGGVAHLVQARHICRLDGKQHLRGNGFWRTGVVRWLPRHRQGDCEIRVLGCPACLTY